MVALQETSTTRHSNFNSQSHKGLLSEKSAIVLCGLGVAVFTLPILVVLQVMSGLYWGGVSIYQLLSGCGLNTMDEI